MTYLYDFCIYSLAALVAAMIGDFSAISFIAGIVATLACLMLDD